MKGMEDNMDIEEMNETTTEVAEDDGWQRLVSNVERSLENVKAEKRHQEELQKEAERLLREQEKLIAKRDSLTAQQSNLIEQRDQLTTKLKNLSGKVYPNDPCPCGSGRKYKKCCGRNAS